jgi:hypothetical protein
MTFQETMRTLTELRIGSSDIDVALMKLNLLLLREVIIGMRLVVGDFGKTGGSVPKQKLIDDIKSKLNEYNEKTGVSVSRMPRLSSPSPKESTSEKAKSSYKSKFFSSLLRKHSSIIDILRLIEETSELDFVHPLSHREAEAYLQIISDKVAGHPTEVSSNSNRETILLIDKLRETYFSSNEDDDESSTDEVFPIFNRAISIRELLPTYNQGYRDLIRDIRTYTGNMTLGKKHTDSFIGRESRSYKDFTNDRGLMKEIEKWYSEHIPVEEVVDQPTIAQPAVSEPAVLELNTSQFTEVMKALQEMRKEMENMKNNHTKEIKDIKTKHSLDMKTQADTMAEILSTLENKINQLDSNELLEANAGLGIRIDMLEMKVRELESK